MKQQPSNKTLDFLKDKFKYEVQLYKFIKLEFKKKLVAWRDEWRAVNTTQGDWIIGSDGLKNFVLI